MIYCKNLKSLLILNFIILLFPPFALAKQAASTKAPTASISTTAQSVVLVGSTIQLDAVGSINPEGGDLLYSWSFAKKPSASESSFTTPAPSMPSFAIDEEGLYVVRLIVSNKELASDPKYIIISSITPAGTSVFAKQEFSTPLLCALNLGFLGCTETSRSFNSTPGSYSLNIISKSAKDVVITLNSTELALPSSFKEGSRFSIRVTLTAQNRLKVKVRGGMGSSVNIEIVENTLPQDSNSTPSVGDIRLTTNSNRYASIALSISDSNQGQGHVSELLNLSSNGIASIVGHTFQYLGFSGFKGRDIFDILTFDDARPIKGVISKATMSVSQNTAPRLIGHRVIHVPINLETFRFNTAIAQDSEGDSLRYSLISSPSSGSLSCTNVNNAFKCTYDVPDNFRSSLPFSYRANDGSLNSNISRLILRPFHPNASITKIEAGTNHSCALFNEGNIRCWGRNDHGQLGYGHINNIGDDETPLFEGDVSVGEEVLKLSLGDNFTCALLASGNIKCWGYNGQGQLGISLSSDASRYREAFFHSNINFGTSLRVIDISSGGSHSCALFESGQIKCWGYNAQGQLGLGHGTSIGRRGFLHKMDFIDVGGPVAGLSLGSDGSCALLESGSVKCWGGNTYGQLGQGNTRVIGDDELPSSISTIALGGSAIEITSGDRFNCALLSTGKVKCWGLNNRTQLGLGHTQSIGDNEAPSSLFVTLGANARKITSNGSSSCALLDNGRIQCWGYNVYGQLGSASGGAVSLSETAIDVTVGGSYSCILLISGKMNCWGYNGYGQLGLNTTASSISETSRNVILGGIAPALYSRFTYLPKTPRASTSIKLSAENSFAKNSTISTYSWNFGDESTAKGIRTTHTFHASGEYPVQLALTDSSGDNLSMTKIIRVLPPSDAPFFAKDHSFTLAQGKKLQLNLPPGTDWENNSLTYSLVASPSQGTLTDCLGQGDDISCTYTPPTDFVGKVEVTYKSNDGTSSSINIGKVSVDVLPEGPSIVDISSSSDHSCALFDNKKIKCWGRNGSGQLGYGHRNNIGDDELASAQGFVDVGGDVLSVVTGGSHTCALLVDKTVKCWGTGTSVGGGNNYVYTRPFTINLNYSVKQLVAGGSHTCVLFENERVKCWGYNRYGQLGLGHTHTVGNSPLTLPKNILFSKVGEEVVKLSAGEDHTCALLGGGNLRCWGYNSYGQLGYGNRIHIGDNEHPLAVGNVDVGGRVVDMVLGGRSTCVILSDRTVKCWGYNNYGQLGYGHKNNLGDNELPSTITALDLGGRVEELTISTSHACAVLENNKMKCWGSDQLILEPPRFVLAEENFVDVSVGDFYSCALSVAGDVRCWGGRSSSGSFAPNYQHGQLGLGHKRVISDSIFLFPENSTAFYGGGHVVLARFDYGVSSTNPLIVSFDASKSFSKNTIGSYAWSFGDGMTGSGSAVSHTFGECGAYTVGLTVTDNFGQTHQVSQKVVLEAANENSSPSLSMEEWPILLFYENRIFQ